MPILLYSARSLSGAPCSRRDPACRSCLHVQLEWLREQRWMPLSLADLRLALVEGRQLPSRWFTIAVDGDWEAEYRPEFLAALASLTVPQTLFLPLITRKSAGETLSKHCTGETCLKHWRLISDGRIELGVRTDVPLTRLSNRTTREQLELSRQIVQNSAGVPPRFFLYPEGTFDARTSLLVRNAGFEGAVCGFPEGRIGLDRLFSLPAVPMTCRMSPWSLRYAASALCVLARGTGLKKMSTGARR